MGPHSSTAARSRRPATSKLANDDREGVCAFESLSPAPARFAAEAGLTAYALMAAAAGVVAAYSDITGDKWKPYEPPVAGPATVGRQEAKPRSPASGETIGAGRRTPPCRPTVPSPMARRPAARHPASRLGSRLGGGL
jgi:hypothetical protein